MQLPGELPHSELCHVLSWVSSCKLTNSALEAADMQTLYRTEACFSPLAVFADQQKYCYNPRSQQVFSIQNILKISCEVLTWIMITLLQRL